MAKSRHIKTVEELIEAVGREALTSQLGHATQVVSRAVTEKVMPAHWYVGVRNLCKQHGYSISESLFRWTRKPPVTTQIVNASLTCQEASVEKSGAVE